MRRAPAAILVAALTLLGASSAALLLRTPGGDTVAAPPTSTASPEARPAESLDEQVLRVAGIVEQVRELAFVDRPDLTVLEPGDLAARVLAELESYEEAEADLDRRVLELLGAIPPGTDLRALLLTALGEQVAGFYDPDTGELVVGAQVPDERVGRLEELTLAHELQHALADQVHGLPDLEDETLDDDRLLAVQSLIEGDATATMQSYAEVGFSAVDQLLLAGEAAALAGQLEDMTQLPYILQGSLMFPYTEGAAFVEALRARGGWAAVDAAYDDPPTTTWEVLFPDGYPAGGPVPVAVTTLDAPWEPVRTATVGAADLLLLFEAPGGDPTAGLPEARSLVRAWRGGQLTLHVDGDRSALGVALAAQGSQLCTAVDAWLQGRGAPPAETPSVRLLADGTHAALGCRDGEVRLGLGPDPIVAEALTDPGDA